jgi:hypothetical protein
LETLSLHTPLTLLRGVRMSIQDHPSPSVPQASPHDVIGIGLAFAVAGLYLMLGAAGYMPLPDSNSPAFIGFCAGAAFLFAGLTCVVRARAGMLNIETEVPDDAPWWAGALATIGTWIAIGSGPRAFSISASHIEMQTFGEAIGRAVFGLGAVIVWILVIALTVGTVRKLFDRYGA